MKLLVFCLRSISSYLVIFLSYLLFPVSFFLRLIRVRVLVHGSVIGNLCTQIDAYAKEKKLGRIPTYKFIIYPVFASIFSRRPFLLSTTNNYLCHLWKQHFWVVTNPFWGFLLKPILTAPWLQYERPYFSERPNECFYSVSQEYYKKYPEFSPQSALLKIPEGEQRRGREVLRRWGISEKDWFVCFYAREAGYYDNADFEVQGRVRNVKVESYRKALLEITARGGWCIRLGSDKMNPLPPDLSGLERIIDYPKSSFVSDFMDVFLCANARFMLTCSSGISVMPGLFGVPIAMTNTIPLHIAKPLYPKDLSILKLYYSLPKKRLLYFEEALSSYMTDQPNAYYYDSLHLKVIDNTEEEILELVKEMLERLSGVYGEENGSLLQEKFSELIPQYLFCKYGTGNIGHHFLKTYTHLL